MKPVTNYAGGKVNRCTSNRMKQSGHTQNHAVHRTEQDSLGPRAQGSSRTIHESLDRSFSFPRELTREDRDHAEDRRCANQDSPTAVLRAIPRSRAWKDLDARS